MKKLFVLVPFMVVASMSYSADFEEASVRIIVNKERLSFDDKGGFIGQPGPNDPIVHGEYTILIDKRTTVKDLGSVDISK